MTARNENGKYSYLDEDFEKLFGDYDNATAINGDIGAVKTGSAWKIINKDGKQVGSTEYEDIIIDEKILFVEMTDCLSRREMAT